MSEENNTSIDTNNRLNLPRPKIKIIGASTCQHCHDARDYFSKHNIDHEFIDILEKGNEKYIKDVIADNTLRIPKICREDTGLCVIGFSDDNVRKLMNSHSPTTPATTTNTNTNTNTAGNNLQSDKPTLKKTLHE